MGDRPEGTAGGGVECGPVHECVACNAGGMAGMPGMGMLMGLNMGDRPAGRLEGTDDGSPLGTPGPAPVGRWKGTAGDGDRMGGGGENGDSAGGDGDK